MSGPTREVSPVDGVRAPQDGYGGALAGRRPDDLATLVLGVGVGVRGGVGQGVVMPVERA